MDLAIIVWGGALVLFLLAEGITAGLTSIWFACGALGALIAAACHAPVWLQVLLFLVVSAATLYFTRPLVKKYVNPRRQATNADRTIGQRAVVTEEIDDLRSTGAVKLSGTEWTARSVSGEVIPVGTVVTVCSIQGVKLMVESAGTEEEH